MGMEWRQENRGERDLLDPRINGQRLITLKDVAYFRHRIYIGARVRCMILEGDVNNKTIREVPSECIIKHKGKHVAMTSKGCMQWTLLTIWNLGLLQEWKQKAREEGRIR